MKWNNALLLLTGLVGASVNAQIFGDVVYPEYNYDEQAADSATKRCALVNIAMDESGSMQSEQAFMREIAVPRMARLLLGNDYQYDHVFFCSHGFGAATGTGFRTLGCSVGNSAGKLHDDSIFGWDSTTAGDGGGRLEDGYDAIVSGIAGVPNTIIGYGDTPIIINDVCAKLAKNFVLVTDEDRDVLNSSITKETVRAAIADNGYILNEVVDLDIENPVAPNSPGGDEIVIGMRMNYADEKLDLQNRLSKQICRTTRAGQLCRTSYYYDIENEFFATNSTGTWQTLTNDQDPNIYYSDGSSGNTDVDYVPLITDTRGAVWSIKVLRDAIGEGSVQEPVDPHTVEAFADAFVQIKVNEIDCETETCVCAAPPCRTSESFGDPHITTWRNEHYEFHGQCDLVMLKDENFADGMSIDVHVRTKIIRFWSYIETVAIRIGNDVLEVTGSADADDANPHYWINYEYQGELDTFAGFPVTQELPSVYKRSYKIDLSSKYKHEYITVQIYKEFVRVQFSGGASSFGNSVGLLGNFYSGKTLARDGSTVMNDFVEFGQEWQVLPTEPKLFHLASHPQFPEKCLNPEDPRGERRRRLGESKISIEQAEAACATLKDKLTTKDCVYDILATQDLDMVGAF